MDKELIYQANIKRSLDELYERMSNVLLSWMPEDAFIDSDNLNDYQQECVAAVDAIEQEWILNPEERRQFSLISWQD